MTVSSAVSKAVYDGNGATTVWPVPFEALDAGDVHVFLTNPDNETYEMDAGFTVDLDAGEVTYPSGGGAALPEGWRITLLRQMDLLQETDLINQGAFYAETVEEALDRLTMIAQQHAEVISRTVKVGVSETSMGVELTPDEVLHAADIAVAAASSAGISRDFAQTAMLGAQSARDGAVAAVEGAVVEATAATAADAATALGAAAAAFLAAASGTETEAGQQAGAGLTQGKQHGIPVGDFVRVGFPDERNLAAHLAAEAACAIGHNRRQRTGYVAADTEELGPGGELASLQDQFARMIIPSGRVKAGLARFVTESLENGFHPVA